jgi:hypothetical protein
MRLSGVWTTTAALLLGFGQYSALVMIPQFVQPPAATGYGFGASVTQAGLFLVPTTIVSVITSPISGKLSNVVGSKVALRARIDPDHYRLRHPGDCGLTLGDLPRRDTPRRRHGLLLFNASNFGIETGETGREYVRTPAVAWVTWGGLGVGGRGVVAGS